STTQMLGQGLLLIWSALCLFAAISLLRQMRYAEEVGGFTAAVGFAFGLPALVSGATLSGLALLVGCGLIIYLLWGGSWTRFAVPGLWIAMSSLLISLAVAYFHANQIRTAVFFGPPQPMPELERLIFSANRFAGFITLYYGFLVLLLLLAPVGFA